MKIEQLKLFTDITKPEKNHKSMPLLNSVALCPTEIFTNNLEFSTHLRIDTGLDKNIIIDAIDLKNRILLLDGVSNIEKYINLFNIEDCPLPAIYTGTVDALILNRDEFIKYFPILKQHVSEDYTKQHLQGIHINEAGYLIATNGFSLALYKSEDKHLIKDPFTIPIAALNTLYKILKKDKSISTIKIEHNKPDTGFELIKITTGCWTIISRIIKGQFIDYRHVLPKRTGESIKFDCKQMVTNLKKLLPLAKKRTNVINIVSNDLTVEDCIVADCIENTFPEKIALNISILLYMLKNLSGELELKGNNSLSPLIIESGELTQIIMPILQTKIGELNN